MGADWASAAKRRVRGALEDQCFWAYPPPLVDEDASRGTYKPLRLTGEAVLRQCLDGTFGRDAPFNASLELYRRYKYGTEERKYFRNYARRMAAKYMVEAWMERAKGVRC
jgi:hypothetical protein